MSNSCAARSAWALGGLSDRPVGVAGLHGLAALGARKVYVVGLGWRHEKAHVLQPFGRKPSLPSAALHGKAIGGFLVGAAKLVAALVGMDPQLDGKRFDARQQFWIEDEEPRKSRALIVELVVEHGGSRAADDIVTVDRKHARRHNLSITTHLPNVFFGRRAAFGGGHARHHADS